MDAKELSQQTIEQLQEALQEKRTELAKARFRVAEGQEKNVRKIRILRRDIAQLLTFIHSKTHATT